VLDEDFFVDRPLFLLRSNDEADHPGGEPSRNEANDISFMCFKSISAQLCHPESIDGRMFPVQGSSTHLSVDSSPDKSTTTGPEAIVVVGS
jgi:hypothetical protein